MLWNALGHTWKVGIVQKEYARDDQMTNLSLEQSIQLGVFPNMVH
jgi:hypothetical protein